MRDYMEYHADRFDDYSLMYYKDDKLLSLLPANKRGEALWSHQGLTYGGFVLTNKAHIVEIGEMFDETMQFLHEEGIKEWYYKQMPTIYHKQPSEDDSYWLWRNGAELVNCHLMSAIDLNTDFCISSRRHTYASKLKREGKGDEGRKEKKERQFWAILSDNLRETYNSKPVHTLEEMERLKSLFPQNIICYGIVSPEGNLEGGTLIYISSQVVRTQYISATPYGKKHKALDLLLSHVVDYYKNEGYRYFDFGTSMADDDVNLNESLIQQKEGFGARGIACRTYKLSIP